MHHIIVIRESKGEIKSSQAKGKANPALAPWQASAGEGRREFTADGS